MKTEQKTGREGRNTKPSNSIERAVYELLDMNHAYSSEEKVKALLRQHIGIVLNPELKGTGIIGCVDSSVRMFRSCNPHPLEIADLIKAFAVAHPGEIGFILQGVRNSSQKDDRLAEGSILGVFEAAAETGVNREDAVNSLQRYLGYVIGGRLWIDSDKCRWHPFITGRLPGAMSMIIGSHLWNSLPTNRTQLKSWEHVLEELGSMIKDSISQPKSIHDYVINELRNRLFISAPTYYGVLILQQGMKAAIAELEETLPVDGELQSA